MPYIEEKVPFIKIVSLTATIVYSQSTMQCTCLLYFPVLKLLRQFIVSRPCSVLVPQVLKLPQIYTLVSKVFFLIFVFKTHCKQHLGYFSILFVSLLMIFTHSFSLANCHFTCEKFYLKLIYYFFQKRFIVNKLTECYKKSKVLLIT